jgi:hypothetical protein
MISSNRYTDVRRRTKPGEPSKFTARDLVMIPVVLGMIGWMWVAEIAAHLKEPEHIVCRWIWHWRELSRS